jgi:hypothetical protein
MEVYLDDCMNLIAILAIQWNAYLHYISLHEQTSTPAQDSNPDG